MPGELHTHKKALPPTAATRQYGVWQKELSPHLAAEDRWLMQRAGLPVHIDPPRGKA
jgi:hypothetical protein